MIKELTDLAASLNHADKGSKRIILEVEHPHLFGILLAKEVQENMFGNFERLEPITNGTIMSIPFEIRKFKENYGHIIFPEKDPS